MWFVFAVLSAVFAALTSILAKGWHRWRELASCYCCQNGGGIAYGVGNGVSYARTEWYIAYKQKELDFSDSFRSGNRRFMAVL